MELVKQILIKHNNEKYLFSCIKDLILNGFDLSRFTQEESKPTRQDVTQYIAKWFKYTGVSKDQCSEWLIDYSINVLSEISNSSISRIRHSTKSNIKYIYNSENHFEC